MADLNTRRFVTGPIYARASHVTTFLEKGTFPKIHDDIGMALNSIPPGQRGGALDLGACHGLLSLRANALGFLPVVGLEATKDTVAIFDTYLKRPGVELQDFKLDLLDEGSCDELQGILTANGITTVIARRVLSEVFSTTFGKRGSDPDVIRRAGRSFSAVCFRAGVKRLVVEGRVFNQRSVHPVPKIEAEINALGPGWKTVYRRKEVAILVPNE